MEWKTVKLGEVIKLHDSKRIPLSSLERSKRQGKYPYYGAASIVDYIDDYIFDGDYILLGEDGTVLTEKGTPILQRPSGKFWVSNHAHIITNEANVDFDYLYYLLSVTNISSVVTGAVQMKMSQKNLVNIEVQIPSLETQRRIAAILSSFDDKIENNNRINRNLEAQAQALFKSWFVDFEPWGGTMPEDWREGTLGEIIAEIESGSRPKGGAQTSGIPSIGAEKIERFGIYDFSGEKYVSEEFFHKMRRGHVKDGDVMLYKDGAYTGKCSMALDGFPYKVCAVNEHVFLLRTKEVKYQYYLYLNMIQESVRSMIYTLACSKAAQPGLNTSEVLGVKTIIPAETTIADFNSKIAEMMHTIANNCLESHRLATLRDTLLPKLMKGEIAL